MLDEAELRHLYLEEQCSIRTMATLLHVPTGAIYRALIHYDIPRRSGRFHATPDQPVKARFDEATLRRLYLEEQRSIRDIAALHEVRCGAMPTPYVVRLATKERLRHQG